MRADVIYGIHPVLEALKADRQILHKILLAEGREDPPLRALRRLAQEKGIPLQVCAREVLNRLAGNEYHQGVIGWRSQSPYTSWEDLCQSIRSAPRPALLLILDGIEDPQNFGSLIRTAEASGVQGILIPKDRAVGVTPAAIKASAGAAAHIPVVRVTNVANTLEDLKREGFWIVGADPRGEKSVYEMTFDMDVGLVIGSEGKGIRPLIWKKCDYQICIPMKGKTSSLNAAVAGAIILFEILRQQMQMRNPEGRMRNL
jgi:23S rRNA (guanosine2251-2'-O)-methyltransferase